MSLALFNVSDKVKFDHGLFARLKEVALQSEAGHYRFCLHRDNQSPIQQMLIAVTNKAIFPPHRHPKGKAESLHLIEGEINFFEFDHYGEILESTLLRPYSVLDRNNCFGYRIEGGQWHLPLCISDVAIYHEIYSGPYEKTTDVEVAPWLKGKELGSYISYLRETVQV